VSLLRFSSSMFLAPLMDLPATLGHEIVADDEDGRRVTVDVVLGCEALGREDRCPPCAAFQPQGCRRFGEDAGGVIGYADTTGGGWSEDMVAPWTNVFEVPAELTDTQAALLEPAAVSLHAALLAPVRPPVLVVGAGVVGLTAVAALRALDPGLEIVALAKHAHQAVAAEEAGATAVRIRADGSHAEELAAGSGARLAGPSVDQPTVAGGFATVFECVGATPAVDLAFRFTQERGTTVLVGGSAYAEGLDLAPTWAKELRILGSYCYGYEEVEGERIRTFDLLHRLVAEGRLRLGEWVTHRFALEDYAAALGAALGKGSGALKVAFEPAREPGADEGNRVDLDQNGA